MGTAKFIKQRNGTGDGRVYRVDPPVEYDGGTSEYVWVSATWVLFSGMETYIFACDEDGEVLSWRELPGSYQGGNDHSLALENAGYSIE